MRFKVKLAAPLLVATLLAHCATATDTATTWDSQLNQTLNYECIKISIFQRSTTNAASCPSDHPQAGCCKPDDRPAVIQLSTPAVATPCQGTTNVTQDFVCEDGWVSTCCNLSANAALTVALEEISDVDTEAAATTMKSSGAHTTCNQVRDCSGKLVPLELLSKRSGGCGS
jgi:hypothetical protein